MSADNGPKKVNYRKPGRSDRQAGVPAAVSRARVEKPQRRTHNQPRGTQEWRAQSEHTRGETEETHGGQHTGSEVEGILGAHG